MITLVAASSDRVRKTFGTDEFVRLSVYGFDRGVLRKYERGTTKLGDFLMTVAINSSFS